MEKEFALSIATGAFKTVFPESNFNNEKEVRWRQHRDKLARFHNAASERFFRELVGVVFYSGFRAETVTSKMKTIQEYLGDYKKVAAFTEEDISHILSADNMIKNRKKIWACVHNARAFLELDRKYGSFREYLLSISNKFPDDPKNIPELLEQLKEKFEYVGPRTSRHFLMIMGFPMVKPDVIVMRVLFRLGLLPSETAEYIAEASKICLEIAELADIPPEFIDELLVKIGQSEGVQLCKKYNPTCEECGLRALCNYKARDK